jgi:hypothetical protein
MKFTATLYTPTLKLEASNKAISQAIYIWLETVLMEIPVWSGASRATFIKLAQTIEYNVPIAPVTLSREGIGSAESAGGLRPTDKGQYVFYYSTSLPWLVWNEYNNANVNPDPTLFNRVIKEGPYNFQLKGILAFTRFASTVDLPVVTPHIKQVRVNYG